MPRTVGSSIEARADPYRRAKRYSKPGPHIALHVSRTPSETSPKQKVYDANVRFFVYDVGYGHCELCCVDGIFWALAERPVPAGGKMASRAVCGGKEPFPGQ